MTKETVSSIAPELVLRDVTKFFVTSRGRLNALENIDLDIREGEFLCLVGPSGCGKSTLLNMVAGLEPHNGGTIHLDGKLVTGPSPERVVVFQEGGLFPWLTVQDNVEYGLKVRGVPAGHRRELSRYYLRLVHLEKFAQSYIHELSGGMRQRVAIARGLILEPRILLMDEPFAALDTQTRDLLVEELRAIWSKVRNTVLFVTHNVREAVYLGDRVVLMSYRPGRIKKIYPVDIPRPRDPDSPEMETLIRSIVEDLHEEVEKAVRDEMNR